MKKIMNLFYFVSILGIVLIGGGMMTANSGMSFIETIQSWFGWFELPDTMDAGQSGQAYTTPEPEYGFPSDGFQTGLPESGIIPTDIQFYLNNIMIGDVMASSFIPIYKDRLNVYTGKFGPYDSDPRTELAVKLCSFPTTFPNALNCETMPLSYMDNYVFFARGYPEDEYIARQALKNFGARYYITDKTGATMAQSSTAILKLIEHN